MREVKGRSVPDTNIEGMKNSFFLETGFNDPIFNDRPDGVLDAHTERLSTESMRRER